MKSSSGRSSLMALVGVYLLYTAWEMYGGMQSSSMAPWLSILFIVFFVLAGIGVLVFAWLIWKRGREGKDQEEQEDHEDGLKG
jgi:threonine/homoserine/homoserine lactone efflux protein